MFCFNIFGSEDVAGLTMAAIQGKIANMPTQGDNTDFLRMEKAERCNQRLCD